MNDEDSLDTERDKQTFSNQLAKISAEQDEKLLGEIQMYEKRIQGLIEGVGMLKERVNRKSCFFLSTPFSLGTSSY